MTGDAWDDLMEAEGDLRHLSTLVDVIADRALDMQLSPAAAPADHAALGTLRDLLWIARDVCDRSVKKVEGATRQMAKKGART